MTTGDILVAALNAGYIDEARGNQIWRNVLTKRRKLPTKTFTGYLKTKSYMQSPRLPKTGGGGILLVINNMLEKGHTLDEIQEMTGLTKTQIKELQKKAEQIEQIGEVLEKLKENKVQEENLKEKIEQIREILESLKENEVQKGNLKKDDALKWSKQIDKKPDPIKIMKDDLKKNNTKKNDGLKL